MFAAKCVNSRLIEVAGRDDLAAAHLAKLFGVRTSHAARADDREANSRGLLVGGSFHDIARERPAASHLCPTVGRKAASASVGNGSNGRALGQRSGMHIVARAQCTALVITRWTLA